MKPNGLVEAAPMTQQGSIRSFSHIYATRLTDSIFSAREVLFSILTISALLGHETGTTLSTAVLYSAWTTSVQFGVMPPTTFGVLRTPYFGLAGSIRSGEKATKTFSPMRKPLFISRGRIISSVVPGY